MNNITNSTNTNGYHASNGSNGHFVNKNQPQNNNNNEQNNNSQNDSIDALGSRTWQSLKKLYGQNTSEEDRCSADHFLSKYLPNQQCCWHIFAKFLSTDNVPHEVHFFAANMLRSKIQRNLHEVPSDSRRALHTLIVKTLIHFSSKGDLYENVRTQLSIGLALLCIQETSWHDEVCSIIDSLSKLSTLDILLNILTRLAEELYTFHIPISPKIKQIASNNLRSHASRVLRLLHDLFGMVSSKGNQLNEVKIKLKILTCFAAWLDFMDTHFVDFISNYSVLTCHCFASLNDSSLFKEACCCISKILRLSDGDTRRYDSDLKKEEINALMKKQFNLLIPNILSLRTMYASAVSRCDIETCFGLTRLFVDTAEKYCDWIISSSMSCVECRQLIQMIIDCSAHSDTQISTYVCIFWEKLCEPFVAMARDYKRNANADELYDSFDRPWPNWAKPYVFYDANNDANTGLIASIIPNTVRAAKLSIDFEDLEYDEQEDAMQLRWQIADVIGDICSIIGLNNVLHILSGILSQFETDKDNDKDNDNDIYHCEAVLFCIRCAFPSESSSDLSHPQYRILCQIQKLSKHILIRKTAVQLLATHCGFLVFSCTAHCSLFSYLYQYVLDGLSFASIRRDCIKCILSMVYEFRDYPHIMQEFLVSLFAIYDNITSYCMNTRDEISLIEAIAVLISSLSSVEIQTECINKLLSSHRIAVHMNANETSLYHTMNCISSVFKYFKPKNSESQSILIKLLESMWPDLHLIFNKFTDRDGIMEKSTRILKHVIRNGGHLQFMQSKLCTVALQLLTTLYCTKSQRSSFLYIIWIYVDEYITQNEDAAKQLMNTAVQITQCTFNVLQANAQCFTQLSDIVEDFYELLTQYMKKAPHLIFNSPFQVYFEQIFVRAQHGLLMDQTKPHEAICNFFIDSTYLKRENITKLFEKYGNHIMRKILYGLSGQIRYQRTQSLANLLNHLFKFDAQLCEQLMRNEMKQIKIECEDPTKHQFIDLFLQEGNDSNKRIAICIDWFSASERYLRSRTF